MPEAFPEEFRRDVIAVACKSEAPLRQIAKDFGISEGWLHRWLKIADRDDGDAELGSAREGGPRRVRRAATNPQTDRAARAGSRGHARAVAYLSRDVNLK